MFTNMNVGQCHWQLVFVNHLFCKWNSLISVHTSSPPLEGWGYSHLALSGRHHSRL